jgi:hypothetical protein
MARLNRRLELLEIRHQSLFIKPALIKFYDVGESPSDEDLIESKQAQKEGRLVLCFHAKNMGIENEPFKRAKKHQKKE